MKKILLTVVLGVSVVAVNAAQPAQGQSATPPAQGQATAPPVLRADRCGQDRARRGDRRSTPGRQIPGAHRPSDRRDVHLMGAVIFHVIAWPTLGFALLVFGFAPGAVLR